MPEIIGKSGRERITEFNLAYSHSSNIIKGEIQILNNRLQKFGYNLHSTYKSETNSLFESWENCKM